MSVPPTSISSVDHSCRPAASPPASTATRGLSQIATWASISRLHIVVIATLGTFTFGWIFSGRYLFLLSLVSGLDWFLVNLLNRVVDQQEDQANAIRGADLVAHHGRRMTYGGFLLLGLSFPLLFFFSPAITPLRLAYHLLGLSYNWPLFSGHRRLKQLYFWKNTASAIGFMLTVFGYPLAYIWTVHGPLLVPDITGTSIAISALFFFCFELSYEVIYDLRDAPGDQQAGVRSYAVVHGAKTAHLIIDALLALAMLTLLMGYLTRQIPWRILIMICAPFIQLVLYKRAVRRGITAADCIRLTWLGSTLLLTYHLWILLGLPGTDLP